MRSINLYLIASCLLTACANTTEPPSVASDSPLVKKRLSLHQVGELHTRRSFAAIQLMDDSLEIENYVREQEKANPTFDSRADSIIVKRFESLGFARGSELLLSEFRFDTISRFQMKENTEETIDITFENALGSMGKDKLTVTCENESVRINLPGIM